MHYNLIYRSSKSSVSGWVSDTRWWHLYRIWSVDSFLCLLLLELVHNIPHLLIIVHSRWGRWGWRRRCCCRRCGRGYHTAPAPVSRASHKSSSSSMAIASPFDVPFQAWAVEVALWAEDACDAAASASRRSASSSIAVSSRSRSRSGDDEGGRDASLERCGASLSLSESDVAETPTPPSPPLWRSRDRAGEDGGLVEDVAAASSAVVVVACCCCSHRFIVAGSTVGLRIFVRVTIVIVVCCW
jgi:hypothetical protein